MDTILRTTINTYSLKTLLIIKPLTAMRLEDKLPLSFVELKCSITCQLLFLCPSGPPADATRGLAVAVEGVEGTLSFMKACSAVGEDRLCCFRLVHLLPCGLLRVSVESCKKKFSCKLRW